MLLSMAPTTWNIKSLQYGHKENTNQPEGKSLYGCILNSSERNFFFYYSFKQGNRGTLQEEHLHEHHGATNGKSNNSDWSLLASILSLD